MSFADREKSQRSSLCGFSFKGNENLTNVKPRFHELSTLAVHVRQLYVFGWVFVGNLLWNKLRRYIVETLILNPRFCSSFRLVASKSTDSSL
jgi:hypothetical protein